MLGLPFQQYFGLFLQDNTDFWGNFSVGAEASRHAAGSDTLEIKTDHTSLKMVLLMDRITLLYLVIMVVASSKVPVLNGPLSL
ncbi:MAG: hypothetical protein IPP89_08735 [Saprospiraceae bacterium]|nr:hypothetical protein [Candidatus Brachybacter algidus]